DREAYILPLQVSLRSVILLVVVHTILLLLKGILLSPLLKSQSPGRPSWGSFLWGSIVSLQLLDGILHRRPRGPELQLAVGPDPRAPEDIPELPDRLTVQHSGHQPASPGVRRSRAPTACPPAQAYRVPGPLPRPGRKPAPGPAALHRFGSSRDPAL